MAWMIARDDSENLKHYGVKGMKWRRRKAVVAPKSKAGMISNYSKAITNPYGPYGPVDKLNRPTHGSFAGVPSGLYTGNRFSTTRTASGRFYDNSKSDGRTAYRTSTVSAAYDPETKSNREKIVPVRKLNTQLTNTPATKFVTSGVAIKKKLRSNRRYKASRAGMPSYVRR